MNTDQPMPLEETKDLLMQLRNEAVRERDSNAKKRDKALSPLEKALYGEGFAGWDEHVRILDSTLHHLEAGKRERDALFKKVIHADVCDLYNSDSCRRTWEECEQIAEKLLREEICAELSTTPTNEPQG